MSQQKQATLMNDDELAEFEIYLQELSLDAADHNTRYRIFHSRDGVPELRQISSRYDFINRQEALSFINLMLYRGLADAAEDPSRNPIITPRRVNPNLPLPQPMPVAWMSPAETKAFDLDLDTIRNAQQMWDCKFDSWLDDNGNLYTRYAVAETAPEHKQPTIRQAMHRVSQALHDGSAVRVPIPKGGIMYMARWDTRPLADPTASTD